MSNVEQLKVLYLTDEQVADLDAILHGATERFQREIREASEADVIPKTAFYTDWIKRAEGLRTVLSAAKGPLPEDDDEDDDDE